MFIFKVAPLFFMVLLVMAEKKIELQDIEEDNLRSEKEKQLEKSEARSQEPNSVSAPDIPLDLLKNGFFQYFKEPIQTPQQQRFVHQYAVTEQPERPPSPPTPQYGPPAPQQPMVGYLSNVPMQIYLIPQYYNEPSEQAVQHQSQANLQQQTLAQVSSYQEGPHIQQQHAYIEVPTYVTPTGKTLIRPYSQPVSYVTYAHPTISPIQSTVTPVLAYQMPVIRYPTAISAPPLKGHYQSTQYPETNVVDEDQETEVNIPKPYPSHNDIHSKPLNLGYPRYYNSRTPVTEGYRSAPIELPHPNPLLLKAPPSHLAHIPKVLPMYRPFTKPVYATGSGFSSSALTPRPSESLGPFKRRPTSLIDSYIPSSVQIEYMKRGYAKDALSAYEALSSGRHLSQSSQSQFIPRHYERGFLPNQIYHTAGGGITYGHHKRAPKLDKITK